MLILIEVVAVNPQYKGGVSMNFDSLVVKVCALLSCFVLSFAIIALNFLGNNNYISYLTWDSLIVPIINAPNWIIWSMYAICTISFSLAIHAMNREENIPTGEKAPITNWRKNHKKLTEGSKIYTP